MLVLNLFSLKLSTPLQFEAAPPQRTLDIVRKHVGGITLEVAHDILWSCNVNVQKIKFTFFVKRDFNT